ncbi:MAG: O-antigen ligase family protein, partial [Magnetospirillum sp.]|nr:O-antigen ligase family protein [Magnetospirillum sp.]
ASVVVSIALPSIGQATPSHPGAWNGVFSHKNGLGWVIILASLVYSWKFWQPGSSKTGIALLLLLFLFLSVVSQSKTSFIGSIFSFFAFPALRMLHAPGILRLWVFFIFGAGSILALSMLAMFWTEILTAIGRDPTLTGRVPLWNVLLDFAADHFMLGYGYSSFWIEWNPDADFVWKVIQWDAPEAHNAYLDMLLQLGVFGLALSLLVMYRVIRLSLRDYLTNPQPWTDFVLINTVLSAMTNMVETMLFRSGDVHCWLLPLCYFALCQVQREESHQPVRKPVAIKTSQHPASSSW